MLGWIAAGNDQVAVTATDTMFKLVSVSSQVAATLSRSCGRTVTLRLSTDSKHLDFPGPDRRDSGRASDPESDGAGAGRRPAPVRTDDALMILIASHGSGVRAWTPCLTLRSLTRSPARVASLPPHWQITVTASGLGAAVAP